MMNSGQTIGSYRIIRPLGKGGMGEVYLAEDMRIHRQVALKTLPEGLRHNPERLARFRREAEAAGKLNHPNIAQVYAFEEAVPAGEGIDPDARRDPGATRVGAVPPLQFMVMEYVEGRTLTEYIPENGMELDNISRTRGDALTFFDVFIPLSDALAHAHEHEVIHRDLKPGNIMIREDGTPKILDFGLARIMEPDAGALAPDSQAPTVAMSSGAAAPPTLTKALQLIGTPSYMSPEQIQGQKVDARTDLFSFGVVMYEALTGRRPFESRSPGSDFVAYFTAGSTLYKVATAGGASVLLCNLPGQFSRGGVWRPNRDIIFGVAGQEFQRSGTLYSISAAGGEPTAFAVSDSTLEQRGLIYPTMLPDGALLYAATMGDEAGALVVQRDRERRVILSNRGERVAFPVYSLSGHIIYQRGFLRAKESGPFDSMRNLLR